MVVDGALSKWIDIEQDVRQSYVMSPCMRNTYEDPVGVQIDNVNVLSRLWNGPKSVPGSNTENKVKDILKQRFPQAKSIEVVDISGK
uniref:Uncharacterized protein n=1 Tax=Timema douglasi TaxID=61478 RepID=A0A7R8ZHR8_TIMDO|nr:unnamed protein product [Timema douglasi]